MRQATRSWSRMRNLGGLNARMHVSHGGYLTPYGDQHGVLAETKAGLDQVVCQRAYLLWEQAGRPEGRADDFWRQAQHQRFCERAYALWEREGRREGKADEYWEPGRAPLRRADAARKLKSSRRRGRVADTRARAPAGQGSSLWERVISFGTSQSNCACRSKEYSDATCLIWRPSGSGKASPAAFDPPFRSDLPSLA